MISYEDLFETSRKEKYSEALQLLDPKFLEHFGSYLHDLRTRSDSEDDIFSKVAQDAKKQYENSIGIFKELMLRRKKKLLSLVIVAAETSIQQKDYEPMMSVEKILFDQLVNSCKEGDKEINTIIKEGSKINHGTKKIQFNENVEELQDMNGNTLGPYNAGDTATLDHQISQILVTGGKANFVETS